MFRLLWAAGVCLLAVACGCEKTVELTFLNTTRESLAVELTVPGKGMHQLGVVAPGNGKLTYELKVDENCLPATCAWQAGRGGDEFTITNKSPNKLFIFIRPGGHIGPVDKKTEIQAHRQIEVKQAPIHQEELVE